MTVEVEFSSYLYQNFMLIYSVPHLIIIRSRKMRWTIRAEFRG